MVPPARRSDPITHVDVHRLDLAVSFQAGLTQLSANAALLDTSERHSGIAVLAAVDLDHASLNFRCDAMGALEVFGEDSGA